ncbi:MAG: nucleotidyltransferase domain-containing protein [Ignavibacteriales bacterium]|nr:nucleotidyltransferase domain-containing protein [Ignavibacteriales bacterium]
MTSTELEKITQPIVEKLRAGYAPLKIILFGSYAAGVPRGDSDIDLLIVKETNDRFIDRWVAVRKILSDPSRKIAIETLVLTPQEISDRLLRGDQFVAEIIEKGRVLYAA